MNHEWFQTRVMEVSDAELPDGERERILDHLKTCPTCRIRAERWGQNQKLLSELGKGFFPEYPFTTMVMAEIQKTSKDRPFWKCLFNRIPEWIYPELGLAFAALVLFFVFSTLQHSAVSVETLLLGWTPADIQWLDGSLPPATDATLWEGEV